MAIINQSNILNLQPGITAPVVVHMSEGDSGTKLSFKLIDGARAWTDPGNVVAAVHGRRQDGTQFGPYACTISGDVVSFQTDAAIAAVAGSGIAQIVLTDSDQNTAGTANFAIMVERATFPMGVTYTNDTSVYESILRYVQAIPAAVTEDYTAKINAEATAREEADATLSSNISALRTDLTEEAGARATQDAVLSARMDTFASLPSGSTSGNAELLDIRVKADGTKASTAGNAVREQITELKNDLDENVSDLKSAIDEIVGAESFINGFRLDRNGNLVADPNCCVSDFVPLTAGTNADFYTGVSSTTLIFVLYQSDKTTIVDWFGVTNAENRSVNPLPAGTAYAKMTFLAGYNGKIIKTRDATTVYYDSSVRTDGAIDEINADIDALESEQNAIKARVSALENTGYANYTEGFWLDWHGYLLENDAYCLSERVYIPGGTAIRFWCGESTDSICLVEYAEDGTQIATWGNINKEYRDIVTLKANTAFVRLSFVKGYHAKIGLANTPYVSSVVFYEANDNIGGALEKVPNYYFDNLYLQNKVGQINRLLRGCAANGDGFIFVTDAHWGLNAKKSPSLIDYIAKRTTIDKVFDGGDRYDGYWPEPSRQFMKAIGTQKFYPVVGNHEFLYGSTNSDAFASAFMHLGNSIVWGNPGEFYYYFDNTEQKIRYICLQSFYENAAHDGSGAVLQYSADELAWFGNVALNVDSGWTILIFTHCAITGNDATKTATIPTSGSYGQLISIIENYSGNGEIACVIQGHFHWDYMTQLPTSGVPVVVTTCDKYDFYNEPALADEQRTPGTIDEQAFDVVILDKANRKLTFVRVGDKAVLNGGDGSEVEYREVTY